MNEILESGNVYFFYRPAVEETAPKGLVDVQEFYVVLGPHDADHHRLLVVGQKRLPSLRESGHKAWGFVAMTSDDPRAILDRLGPYSYRTETRGERYQPAARPAGEGVYAIARLPAYAAFAYRLELPDRRGEVQEELGVEREGVYVLTVKNPEASSPPGVGLSEEKRARYPARLQEVFGGRRFVDVDPPELLDYEGAEFLLITARREVPEEISEEVEAETGAPETAEIFSRLGLRGERRPLEPLFRGEWR